MYRTFHENRAVLSIRNLCYIKTESKMENVFHMSVTDLLMISLKY